VGRLIHYCRGLAPRKTTGGHKFAWNFKVKCALSVIVGFF